MFSCMPDCSRYWRMDFRFAGKRGTLAFGVFPIVSLAEAREQRDTAKKQIAAGTDPALQRKLKRLATITVAENTFKAIAEEWLAKLTRENRAEATLKKTRWLLRFALKTFGNRPISQITAPELLAVLRLVEGQDAMKVPNGCAAPAVRYSATLSPPGEPNAILPAICVERSQPQL